MIDWLSFSVRYHGPGFGLQFFKREGLDAPLEACGIQHMPVEGSWSSRIRVKSTGGRLYITGNPAKFLTGQNVVGTNRIGRLVDLMYEGVIDRLDLPPCIQAERDLRLGSAQLTRVDCTFSYEVGTDEEVASWVEAMGRACHVQYRGRGHFRSDMCSLAWGMGQQEGGKAKGSRRSNFKFYNKYREMREPGHAPTCAPEFRDTLDGIALGTVRGEACFRALELERLGVSQVRQWTDETAWKLHRSWVDKMDITDMVELKTDAQKALPRKLQGTYHIWKSGADCKAILSHMTFYRHRRELLDYGVDIAIPCLPASEPVKVVPVIQVLKAVPIDERAHEELFWRMASMASAA